MSSSGPIRADNVNYDEPEVFLFEEILLRASEFYIPIIVSGKV